MYHGKKPTIEHLRTFGCTAYAQVERDHKLSFTAVKCKMLGYAIQQKAYRLWNAAAGKVITSRSVRFDETPGAPLGVASNDNNSTVEEPQNIEPLFAEGEESDDSSDEEASNTAETDVAGQAPRDAQAPPENKDDSESGEAKREEDPPRQGSGDVPNDPTTVPLPQEARSEQQPAAAPRTVRFSERLRTSWKPTQRGLEYYALKLLRMMFQRRTRRQWNLKTMKNGLRRSIQN